MAGHIAAGQLHQAGEAGVPPANFQPSPAAASRAQTGPQVSEHSLSGEESGCFPFAGPARIAALTACVAPDGLCLAPVPGEWSANEVLAHLRACADVWGNCMAAILTADRPVLRAVNPRTWIKETNYLNLEFRPSLDVFATQRAELLAVLQALPPEGWLARATVTVAGKPFERTVLFYAEWLATHERPHVKQIERIVKRAQVGQRLDHRLIVPVR